MLGALVGCLDSAAVMRRYWRGFVAVALYLGVAVFAFAHLWRAPVPAIQANSGADPGQSMWFLSYWAHAVLHGHPSLSTSLINEPYGVNLIGNPSVGFPALLVMPITLLAGPVTAYYSAITLALAASATACYALLRRLTDWWGAALVGGLAFEFSPYMVGAASQHLHLAFVAIPPLVVLVVYELLVPRTSLRPEILGLVLALLVIAQFFTSTEILGTTAVMMILTLGVAAIFQRAARRPLGPPARRLARASAVAAVVAGGVLAYPAWFAVSGPQHVHGLASPALPFRADLAGVVVPTSLQAIAPSWAVHLSSHFVEGNVAENGSYLGLPLLLVCVGGAIWLWRRPVVKVAATMMVVSLVLALGSSLTITGSTLQPGYGDGLWLPERILYHLPLGSDVIAVRFTMYTALCAVVLLAAVLDRLRVWVDERGHSPAARSGLLLAVTAACLIPLLPAWPYRIEPLPVPAYFTSTAGRSIPPGANVLLYPYPALSVDAGAPMVWQSDTFMRFRIAGGYFESGDRDPFFTRVTQTYLTLQHVYGSLATPLTPALRSQIKAEMRGSKVSMVIADPNGPAGRRGVAFLTDLIGRPPHLIEGADVWTGVTWQ